ncbi:cutinase-domain-containing protein [Dendryphion nanum]|uniref:cutinase n=1 Tax=Dendryphion nanum TaxID=256645 RepID=A0A9P9E1Z8_9PLEO|nr:cutinase-domain-containing protein [Dendryphion nanum]
MMISPLSSVVISLLFTTTFSAPTALPITSPNAFPITELADSNLAPEDHLITKRQYSGNTYNQLTDGTACRPISVIYARGTNQAGNVGDPAAVGPIFFNNLASKVGGTSVLAIQGVTYAANVFGFLAGGDPAGSNTMANLVASTATRCPSTKIVLAGYSQGSQVVHNAAQKLSTANAARIAAVVNWGDPKFGQSLGAIDPIRTWAICHAGDNICDGGIIITAAHTNYQQDAPLAATFVANNV